MSDSFPAGLASEHGPASSASAARREEGPFAGEDSYVRWAKTRAVARFDLAGSNLLPVTAAEWAPAREGAVLSEPNEDGLPRLVEAIAAHAGVSTSRVATAAGSSGANFLAIATLVRPGDEVLVERPVYDPLAGAARLMGASVRYVDRLFDEGYRIDVDRVRAALTPRTRLVILTNPHNPTGVVTDAATLAAIGAHAARAGARVLVDEVYRETIYDRPVASAAALGDEFVATSSLTKAYGLWGLRCGWAVASQEVAARIRQTRDLVDAVGAVPAEHLAARAFEDLPALRQRARAIVEPNALRVARFVDARDDVSWVAPGGGTVAFPRLERLADTGPFAARLLAERHTAVVPGVYFASPRHIRIAFGIAPDVLSAGLEALGAALDTL